MILLISPAKTFKVSDQKSDQNPLFDKKTKTLLKHLKSLSTKQIEKDMKVSEKVAQKTYEYYQSFNKHLQPAIFTYFGHQYRFIDADSMNKEHITYLNSHLYIISGLYGLLRPLDCISFYRLEMMDKSFINLYDFWTESIQTYLIKNHQDDILINLASAEFGQIIDKLDFVYTIEFYIMKNNEKTIHSMEAKRMRGLFTNYIITNQINTLTQLKTISIDGYAYDDKLSSLNHIIYTKKG
ncbi:MAG: YaaA family protein [Acholeplasmataceae bacterium]|nr:YaaA family protein [Acholeplasmataceae bacterium]